MELIERLQEFLRNSDLNTTTTGIVRRQLEEDFGVDLSDRKVFIREQVDLFLQSQFENAQDDCENEEEHDDDEDDQAKVKSEGSGASDGEEAEDDDEASNRKGPAKRRLAINNYIYVY